MKNIMVYDIEAEDIETLAEINGISVADVIEYFMENYLEEAKRDNGWI